MKNNKGFTVSGDSFEYRVGAPLAIDAARGFVIDAYHDLREVVASAASSLGGVPQPLASGRPEFLSQVASIRAAMTDPLRAQGPDVELVEDLAANLIEAYDLDRQVMLLDPRSDEGPNLDDPDVVLDVNDFTIFCTFRLPELLPDVTSESMST